MKLGMVTYTSLHCNFTNYGTVLQAWALQQALKKQKDIEPVLVDYCPTSMADKDPLDPMKNMWDTDSESRRQCELSLPAIRENFKKIYDFYHNRMEITNRGYDAKDFDEVEKEGVNRFIIGSDSIFDIDEFGIDDVYFANTPLMKNHSITYAPSFQDSIDRYEAKDLQKLNEYLKNFNAFSIRENQLIQYVKENVRPDVTQVVDPTLLLEPEEYEPITVERQVKEKYLLYYSRRYNPLLESFVENVAKERGLKIVDISLRATNSDKGHIMFYQAGVEEFLSLVKYSDCVITNSFHCLIFALQFGRDFYAFSRAHCDRKIEELLQLVGLFDRYWHDDVIRPLPAIDYNDVRSRIRERKQQSLDYLKSALLTIQ